MHYGVLNEARQGALLDMAYELGVEGLLGFHDMLAALEMRRLGGGERGGAGKRVGDGSADPRHRDSGGAEERLTRYYPSRLSPNRLIYKDSCGVHSSPRVAQQC